MRTKNENQSKKKGTGTYREERFRVVTLGAVVGDAGGRTVAWGAA